MKRFKIVQQKDYRFVLVQRGFLGLFGATIGVYETYGNASDVIQNMVSAKERIKVDVKWKR